MRYLLIAVLLIAITISAAAKQNKNSKKAKPPGEILSVIMHRTGCYGHCPDYTIEVNKDGIATYTGIRFTPDSGAYQKVIGIGKAKTLLAKFTVYKVDTCKDEYENPLPDLPGIIFIIKYKTRTKSVYNASYGPSFLKKLAASMDAVLGKQADESWKKIIP